MGKFKKIAFIAYPTKRPAGKLPLHGGGDKKTSVQQLARFDVARMRILFTLPLGESDAVAAGEGQ